MKLSKLFGWIVLLACMASVIYGADDSTKKTLWQIGQKDKNFSDLALSKNNRYNQYNSQFPKEVHYTIGESSPAKDWPYVHPGQVDQWAGGKLHPFTIRFNLDQADYKAFALNINLNSSHNGTPPKVTVKLNQLTRVLETNAGPGDNALTDPSVGTYQNLTILCQANVFKPGQNSITITTNGSWMIYDSVELIGYTKLNPITDMDISVDRESYRRPEGESRLVNLNFIDGFLTSPATITAKYQGKTITQNIDPGDDILTSAQCFLPVDDSSKSMHVEFTLENNGKQLRMNTEVDGVRQFEIHMVHQTHLDIGYTHTQEDVLKRQIDHLEKALQYIDDTKDMPEIDRFKWHPEGMWAVDEFFRIEPKAAIQKFIKETKTRDIHIDALYAQAMTGAYSEEELFELIGSAARYGEKYGVTVDSAMQTDVPGYTWGIVNALAHHGVKYMSAGPNWGHRVGHTFELADQPFYWESPCGTNRILLWVSGRPYSWPMGSTMTETFKKIEVDKYLNELEEEGYPYNIVMIRYGMGGDNGPPNPSLPRFVKEWNDKYVWPKVIISRNSDVLRLMEERYGDQLPVLTGDFTPYWEDGMASTSADTGISRRAAEELVQAQSLWTMLDTKNYPHERFELAWNKLIMYDEHTWGAHNSISAPDDDFAIQQAVYKQKYALDGASITDELFNRAVKPVKDENSNVVDVYNTLNWSRSELVYLQPDQSTAGDLVVDADGKALPSQRLKTGELAFWASDVPAFSAKRYTVKKGKATTPDKKVKAKGNTIENEFITCSINPETGAINSLKLKENGKDFADNSKGFGINDYLYIIGRDAEKNNSRIDSSVKIKVLEAGPLVATLNVYSDAPGAKSLSRTIHVSAYSPLVTMDNVVDKLKERRPEGVYFDFPFNVPDGIMKIDTPWAVIQPEKDQLSAANRNFFCVQRFVDISNQDYGITWMSLDAPIVQWDPIKIAQAWGPHYFRRSISPNQTIHSWVMNNHWETNYKADQEGKIPFTYALWPHANAYTASQSQEISRAVNQPLQAVLADKRKSLPAPKLGIQGEGIVVTSFKPCRDGNGYMIRLFNTNPAETAATVNWHDNAYTKWMSNPMEHKISKVTGPVKMKSQEIVTLRIVK